MGLYHKFYKGQDLVKDDLVARRYGIYVDHEFLVLSVPRYPDDDYYSQVLLQFDAHLQEKLMDSDEYDYWKD